MASCAQEIDQVMLKVQRAVSRAHSLSKKRSDYERALSVRAQQRPRSAAPKGHGCQAKANPHRVARSATRTCLAKGTLRGASDVPAIIFTGSGGWRKPGVASAVSFQAANDGAVCVEDRCCSQEYLEDLRRSEYDSCLKDLSSIGMADADTTASGESNSHISADQPKLGDEDASSSPLCVESASPPRLLDVQEVGEEEEGEASELKSPSDASPQALPATPEDLGRARASDDLLSKRHLEIDQADSKMRRAASRARSLHIKRSEYERTTAARLQRRSGSQVPERQGEKAKSKPHHSVRNATRTILSKGLLESSTDMPAMIFTGRAGWRKPSVAMRMVCGAVDLEGEARSGCIAEADIVQDARLPEHGADAKAVECDLAEADTTASGESDSDAPGARSRLASEESCSSQAGENADESMALKVAVDAVAANREAVAAGAEKEEQPQPTEEEDEWEVLRDGSDGLDGGVAGWSLIA